MIIYLIKIVLHSAKPGGNATAPITKVSRHLNGQVGDDNIRQVFTDHFKLASLTYNVLHTSTPSCLNASQSMFLLAPCDHPLH